MLNEWKIRKLLNDDRYSLNCEYDEEGRNIIGWKVYKKYQKTTLSDYPVITSETCSEKELLKFAKKHRSYGMHTLYNRVFYILLGIIWTIIFANLKIDSTYLDGIVIGMDIALFILIFSNWSIQNKKFKAMVKDHEEDIKELLDKLIDDLKKSITTDDNR